MENPAQFHNFLLWLGQDLATGDRQYEEMRQKLIALFRFRGCKSPEDLADETFDRTALAILKPGFVYEGNPIAYLRGVAHNVCHEHLRRERIVSQESLPELSDTVASLRSHDSGIEQIHDCLDRCLAKLSKDKRDLLLRYYRDDKSAKIDGRLQLAQELAIELNTLRLKIFRLRNTVRDCVESCMKAAEMESRI